MKFYNFSKYIDLNQIDNILANLFDIFSFGSTILVVLPIMISSFHEKFSEESSEESQYIFAQFWARKPFNFKIFKYIISLMIPINLIIYYIHSCFNLPKDIDNWLVFFMLLFFLLDSFALAFYTFNVLSVLTDEIKLLGLAADYEKILHKMLNTSEMFGLGKDFCYYNELIAFFNKNKIHKNTTIAEKERKKIIYQLAETFANLTEQKSCSVRTWILIFGISYALGQQLWLCTNENALPNGFKLLDQTVYNSLKDKNSVRTMPIHAILYISLLLNTAFNEKIIHDKFYADLYHSSDEAWDYNSDLLRTFLACYNIKSKEIVSNIRISRFLYNYNINVFLNFVEEFEVNFSIHKSAGLMVQENIMSYLIDDKTLKFIAAAFEEETAKKIWR